MKTGPNRKTIWRFEKCFFLFLVSNYCQLLEFTVVFFFFFSYALILSQSDNDQRTLKKPTKSSDHTCLVSTSNTNMVADIIPVCAAGGA